MKKITHIFIFVLITILISQQINALDSLTVFLQRGGHAIKNSDYKKALKDFGKALDLDENNFVALKNLGVAHSAIGNQETAKDFFKKAYRVDASDPELNNNLGVMFSDEKDYKKAIKYFLFASNLAPNRSLFLTNLAREYARTGLVAKAMPLLRKADSLAPNNAVVLFTLGTSFASSSAYDSAEYYFDRSEKAGGSEYELFYFQGRVKQSLGKIDEAEKYYKKALSKKVDYKDCLQSLGMIYFTTQRYSEATAAFNQASKIDTTFYPAFIGLGASYSLDGFVPQADSVLKKLFAVDSAMGFQMLQVISSERKKNQK